MVLRCVIGCCCFGGVQQAAHVIDSWFIEGESSFVLDSSTNKKCVTAYQEEEPAARSMSQNLRKVQRTLSRSGEGSSKIPWGVFESFFWSLRAKISRKSRNRLPNGPEMSPKPDPQIDAKRSP